jgi:ABC-type sugar transport system ATPase subunit
MISTPSTTILTNMFKLTTNNKSMSQFNSKQKQVENDNTVDTEPNPTFVEKSVSFAPLVKVCCTITRRDYSMDEISMCWYSAEEYSQISEQCIKQIEKLNRGEKLNGRKYCTRGLEGHTKVRSHECIQAKKLAHSTVLNEQDNQVSEGVWNEELMSKIYQDMSSSSKFYAHMVALCDERAVKKIMAKDCAIR